jgi:uncharacterized membrane protein YraQ (UPF0718 family)
VREVSRYFFSNLWKTILLVSSGIFFALTIGSFLNMEIVSSLQKEISLPLQIIYAELIGFVSPGPRYILYPILATLKDAGISMSIIIALISGHVLIEPSTFFVESGFFGYKFPLKRFLAAFIVTFLAGIITSLIY